MARPLVSQWCRRPPAVVLRRRESHAERRPMLHRSRAGRSTAQCRGDAASSVASIVCDDLFIIFRQTTENAQNSKHSPVIVTSAMPFCSTAGRSPPPDVMVSFCWAAGLEGDGVGAFSREEDSKTSRARSTTVPAPWMAAVKVRWFWDQCHSHEVLAGTGPPPPKPAGHHAEVLGVGCPGAAGVCSHGLLDHVPGRWLRGKHPARGAVSGPRPPGGGAMPPPMRMVSACRRRLLITPILSRRTRPGWPPGALRLQGFAHEVGAPSPPGTLPPR